MEVLQRYASDTWRSLAAMVDGASGLPADGIDAALSAGSRAAFTSPTNIGGYLWSTVAARELGLIAAGEATARVARTLDTLGGLATHQPSGMFHNWYRPATGEVTGTFVSSVDNGWLAVGLRIVAEAVPGVAPTAMELAGRMDFGFLHDGYLRNGFWPDRPDEPAEPDEVRGVWFKPDYYDVLNSESRIAAYVGIATGQLPAELYFRLHRTFPPGSGATHGQEPLAGPTRTYLGVPVFEGTYRYRDLRFVPSWGGDMFEALMPDLFVPEAAWAPRSWGRNHPVYVRGQIAHADHWGLSPCADPDGDYGVFGVPEMGLAPDGYPSTGVVTPHASFLALPYATTAALDNLDRLRVDFGMYGPGGFHDAVNVHSGRTAARHLALDQAMILAAVANHLRSGVLRRAFTAGRTGGVLRPLLALEEFAVPPR